MYSSMLTHSVHSRFTEDGRHNHSLGVDYTLFGSHRGSNFMSIASQLSFGPDLGKFQSRGQLHLHADYGKI